MDKLFGFLLFKGNALEGLLEKFEQRIIKKLEEAMSELSAEVQNVKDAVAGAESRIQADITTLEEKLAAALSLDANPEVQAAVQSLRETVAQLNLIDPVKEEQPSEDETGEDTSDDVSDTDENA